MNSSCPSEFAVQPTVDWAETESLKVLASCEHFSSPWVRFNQILGRRSGGLWLYVHEVRWRDGELERESFSKTFIPEPLEEEQCRIEQVGARHWILFLATRGEGPSRRRETSRVTEEGGWLTADSVAGPGHLRFNANDRSLLEGLREALLGRHSAASAQGLSHLRKLGEWAADAADEGQPSLPCVARMEEMRPGDRGPALVGLGSHILPRLLKWTGVLKQADRVGKIPPANAA